MKFDFTKSKIIRLSLFIAVLTIVAYAGNVYVKEGVVSDADGQIKFGAWAARTIGTVYQAATDGFVTCGISTWQAGDDGQIVGYTDGSNPPATGRVWGRARKAVEMTDVSISFPVRKGDYYKCSLTTYGGTVDNQVMYWIPTRV